MFRLRVPITPPKGERLRVGIYARYSTSEQDKSSIEDQFRLCRNFLKENGVEDAIIEEFSDEETSGELASRPGIDRARSGLEAKRWHVFLSEDSSRLFRNHSACFEFVDTAFDNGIRVVCIHDFVDTNEPDWESRLNDAQRRHCEFNRYLRARLGRRMVGLWNSGAAVAPLRSGYRRCASVPATATEPEKGPFFDEIDQEWMPTTVEIYTRIANLEPPWSVVQYR